MHIIRGILIFAALIFLFVAGGPVLGVMISSWTFMVPILFVVAILALAGWKIKELIRRKV